MVILPSNWGILMMGTTKPLRNLVDEMIPYFWQDIPISFFERDFFIHEFYESKETHIWVV